MRIYDQIWQRVCTDEPPARLNCHCAGISHAEGMSLQILYQPLISSKGIATNWQGNNAAVVDRRGNVVQQTIYYPYGEPTIEPVGQRYLFGGKEREHAGGRNTYDFGARCLTPYGNWGVPDQLAEKFYRISPYSYCLGDPINHIDPDGEEVRSLSIDPSLIRMAEKYPDNGNIIIFTHGSATHLEWNTLKKDEKISDGATLLDAINHEFQSVDPMTSHSEPLIIELHACQPVRDSEGLSALAKKFSKKLSNVIVKAPAGYVLINSNNISEFVAERILKIILNNDGTKNVIYYSPPEEWYYYFRGQTVKQSDINSCIKMIRLSQGKQILAETMKTVMLLPITIPTIPNQLPNSN